MINTRYACRMRIHPTSVANTGFSLIELLITLTIVSLLWAYAVPGTGNLLRRMELTAATNRIVGAVNLTRHTAVQFGQVATLCGLQNNMSCGADWSGPLSVFLDTNRNARLDTNETLLNVIQRGAPETSVRWRSFQNRQYLQMTPLGFTNYQNGNFVICSKQVGASTAKQLVVNLQGRARLNRRLDAAGLPVDYRGRPLRC